MEKHSGDITQAAKELGLTPKTLERKLKRLAGGPGDDAPDGGEES
jgi:DNA-binding NtrC family response regulator